MCISCYSALLLEKGNFAHEVSLCNRDLDVLTMCRMAQSEPPNPSVGLCGSQWAWSNKGTDCCTQNLDNSDNFAERWELREIRGFSSFESTPGVPRHYFKVGCLCLRFAPFLTGSLGDQSDAKRDSL